MAESGWLARRLAAAGLAAALAVSSGCSDDNGAASPSTIRSGSGGGTSATADDLFFCVAETNRLRATVGATVLLQSPEIEAYAALAARADGQSNTTHGYTSGPNGPRVSFAENEALRWSLARYGSIRGLVMAALAAFWNEGPGGSHYENMRGPWINVGCGLYVNGDQVTLVQHFR